MGSDKIYNFYTYNVEMFFCFDVYLYLTNILINYYFICDMHLQMIRLDIIDTWNRTRSTTL